MLIKREFAILGSNEVNEENIRALFLQYGRYSTIYVLDSIMKCVKGIFTFGTWRRSGCLGIDETFKFVLEDERVEQKCQKIFNQYKNIISVPVLDSQKRIIAEVIRYDTLEELEEYVLKEKVQKLYGVIMQPYLRVEVKNMNLVFNTMTVGIIGRNHYIMDLCSKLSMDKFVQFVDFTDRRIDVCDIVIDVDIQQYDIRMKEKSYGNIYVYTLETFLDELYQCIVLEYFSKWNRISKISHDEIQNWIEKYCISGICVSDKRFLSREIRRFMEIM